MYYLSFSKSGVNKYMGISTNVAAKLKSIPAEFIGKLRFFIGKFSHRRFIMRRSNTPIHIPINVHKIINEERNGKISNKNRSEAERFDGLL